ncbi:MAG: leucine-rich repeat domain-containing protein [Oscillospiraceae bacterium]|nr:leucine-rich repeat domain-containing protein [Oscillospiraceae bacterium]
MNMKKVIAAVLAAASVLSLAGCVDNKTSGLTSTPISKADGTSSVKGTSTAGSTSSVETGGSSAPESTSSVSDSKPTQVDWSSVPEIDEMDMEYEVVEWEKLKLENMDKYPVLSDTKDKYKNGIAVITEYYGDAEYIKIPQTISGKNVIVVLDRVNWGDDAKAIKFPDGFCCDNIWITLGNGLNYNEIGTGFAKNAVSISLPDSLQYIQSVKMQSLETLTLPKSLKVIEANACRSFSRLKEVDFPSGLEVIGNMAFYQLPLENITLPSGLKEIGENAFKDSWSLKKVDIPDSVTKIGKGAFEGCEGIEISYKGNTYNEKNIAKLYGKDLSTM